MKLPSYERTRRLGDFVNPYVRRRKNLAAGDTSDDHVARLPEVPIAGVPER